MGKKSRRTRAAKTTASVRTSAVGSSGSGSSRSGRGVHTLNDPSLGLNELFLGSNGAANFERLLSGQPVFLGSSGASMRVAGVSRPGGSGVSRSQVRQSQGSETETDRDRQPAEAHQSHQREAGLVKCSGRFGLLKECSALVKEGVDGAVSCPGCALIAPGTSMEPKVYCRGCATGRTGDGLSMAGIFGCVGTIMGGSSIFRKCPACGLKRCSACCTGETMQVHKLLREAMPEMATTTATDGVPNELAPMPNCVGCNKSLGTCRDCSLADVESGHLTHPLSNCVLCQDAFCSYDCRAQHPDAAIASGDAPYVCVKCYEEAEAVAKTGLFTDEEMRVVQPACCTIGTVVSGEAYGEAFQATNNNKKEEEEMEKVDLDRMVTELDRLYLEDVADAFRARCCSSCRSPVDSRDRVLEAAGQATPMTVKRCGGCKAAIYCNRSCQAKDWAGHRRNCGALRMMRYEPKLAEEIGLLRGDELRTS